MKIEELFPEADPGLIPFGSRVIVQIRSVPEKTESGIWISAPTKEAEKWNTQVAKVISLGPVAFRDRKTLDLWPEGSWAQEGDFVRVPLYGGEKWEIDVNGRKILFVLFDDTDIIGKLTGDPTKGSATF